MNRSVAPAPNAFDDARRTRLALAVLAAISLSALGGGASADQNCDPASPIARAPVHHHVAHRVVGVVHAPVRARSAIHRLAVIRDCLPHDAQIVSLSAYAAPTIAPGYGPTMGQAPLDAAIPTPPTPPIESAGGAPAGFVGAMTLASTSGESPSLIGRLGGGASESDGADSYGRGPGAIGGLNTSGAGLNSPLPGVPEPSTWAMIISGLFSLGAVMRRGRTARPAMQRV